MSAASFALNSPDKRKMAACPIGPAALPCKKGSRQVNIEFRTAMATACVLVWARNLLMARAA